MLPSSRHPSTKERRVILHRPLPDDFSRSTVGSPRCHSRKSNAARCSTGPDASRADHRRHHGILRPIRILVRCRKESGRSSLERFHILSLSSPPLTRTTNPLHTRHQGFVRFLLSGSEPRWGAPAPCPIPAMTKPIRGNTRSATRRREFFDVFFNRIPFFPFFVFLFSKNLMGSNCFPVFANQSLKKRKKEDRDLEKKRWRTHADRHVGRI